MERGFPRLRPIHRLSRDVVDTTKTAVATASRSSRSWREKVCYISARKPSKQNQQRQRGNRVARPSINKSLSTSASVTGSRRDDTLGATQIAIDEKDATQNLVATARLLARARSGDRTALEALYLRYLPRLRRWARARLPRGARGVLDTNDVVQDALVQTLHHLDAFDPKHSGAFGGYLRKIVRNRIIDEVRRVQRRPEAEAASSGILDPGPSPLDEAIGSERVDCYERAFALLRIGCLTLPSHGWRMAVKRALVRLAGERRTSCADSAAGG